jgi:hypothetical protein
MPSPKTPKLPELLKTKIYKTGQTRGADDDVVFQNRVSRKSTVLIPFSIWEEVSAAPEGEETFESGFICLISPKDFFETDNIQQILLDRGLSIGINALIFYQIRTDWERFNPEVQGWSPANSRTSPLLGQYVARIAATTANNGEKISRGFNTTGMKGAGIRLFEYATTQSINECRVQLEAIFWLCHDSLESVIEFDMLQIDAVERRDYCLAKAQEYELLNFERLKEARMVNEQHQTICPLCLEPLSSYGFFKRLIQATGREVHDLTVTEINLFHIKELRFGEYNHRAYNLGWGHHHCNVVVKDSGIDETLNWMEGVVARNKDSGYME